MQTRKALRNFGGQVDSDVVSSNGPLSKKAKKFLDQHATQLNQLKHDQKYHQVAAALPSIEVARTKINHLIGHKIIADAPVVSKFDAFAVVKKASKADANDQGLRKLSLLFERLWHQDPMGSFTASALTRYRDQYQQEYSKSKVATVINESIPKVAFNNLPVAHLTRIAAEIVTQDDFDKAVARYNLGKDDVQSVRSRMFIMSMVNQRLGGTPEEESGDISQRVSRRLQKDAQHKTVDEDVDLKVNDTNSDIKSSDLGIDGTGMLPIMNTKAESDKGAKQPEFEPEVNEQQPPQESIKPADGLKVLKASITSAGIEGRLIKGEEVKLSNYKLSVEDDNSIRLSSKAGVRKYRMFDIQAAIEDFVYLVNSTPITSIPLFKMQDGIRLACPQCDTLNSYIMPKVASDLRCDVCDNILPAEHIAALGNLLQEEVSLVTYIPESLAAMRDTVIKAAQEIGFDEYYGSGQRLEFVAFNKQDNELASIWDKMVSIGLHPVAQMMPDMQFPPDFDHTPSGDQDLAPAAGPGPAPNDELESEDPMESPEMARVQWPDTEVVKAALIHYQQQGMNPVSAISQFNKDYGDEFNSEAILQMAATVWGINLDTVRVAVKKEAGDLPVTKVNPQQPDAIVPQDLGPDSETHGEIPSDKVNQQVPAQNQSGTSEPDSSTQPDTDNKDPGSFGAERPKAQHPAKDQKGTSLSDTNMGQHSDSKMGPAMKKMDNESAGAQSNVRSAAQSAE